MDASTDSVLFLTNESNQPARVGLSITAESVHYYLTSLELAPYETRAIDIRQLRDAQVADFKGDKIPLNATDSSVNWVRIDDVPMCGRLMVIRKGQGVVTSYDCPTCMCPLSAEGLIVSPANSFEVLPGQTWDCTATLNSADCNGNQYYTDVTAEATWDSSDTSVGTVNSYGVVTAIASGSTNITAWYTADAWWYNPNVGECESNSCPYSSTTTCNVQVPTSLKYINTVSQQPISSCTVTINGQNYPGAGWQREITWQVLDQNGNPILQSGLQPSDSLANAGGTNTCAFPATGGKTGTGVTDSSGEFPDTYSICSTACVNGGNCQSTEDQSWKVSGIPLSGSETVVYECTKITINGQ